MYETGDDQPVELIFDDVDLLTKTKQEEKPLPLDEIEEDAVGIDEKNDIKNLPYSLKISDEDSGVIDDDE
jgi:hypothetical protein